MFAGLNTYRTSVNIQTHFTCAAWRITMMMVDANTFSGETLLEIFAERIRDEHWMAEREIERERETYTQH